MGALPPNPHQGFALDRPKAGAFGNHNVSEVQDRLGPGGGQGAKPPYRVRLCARRYKTGLDGDSSRLPSDAGRAPQTYQRPRPLVYKMMEKDE
jgi:hypothetical protein